jgi:hypothetical protein
MEIAIPLVALASLYVVSNQSKKPTFDSEPFANRKSNYLPNTNMPDKNYPSQYPIDAPEIDLTSSLSTVNTYQPNHSYTDKYFNPNQNQQKVTAGTGTSVQTKSGEYYSLTGDKVEGDYFQHNNMVPYFGSHIRQPMSNANNQESILDNMGGSGSQSIVKKEQSPMFAPGEHIQYAYGAPNNTDFYQSRVNVGMKMSNVNPFAEENVGPGLGLGYTANGSGGFNSGMMDREAWLPKTANELRVANNPKPSGNMLFGHEGPAMSHITNLGSIGQMEKNRPDTTYAMGPDRLLTTTGLEKGQTLRPTQVDRYVSRPETTVDYTGTAYGGAGNSGNSSNYDHVTGEYQPSTNIQLGAVPLSVANAVGRNYASDGDFGMKSQFAYQNNRTSNYENRPDNYFGVVGGAFKAVVAPLLDMLRPSRKENTIGTLRPYQNPKSVVPESYIFNPADRPSATIRETTENSKFHLNINANQRGGAYAVTEYQGTNTARQLTSDYYYAGNASAGERSRQPRPYDAEYNQRNNDVKSSTLASYTPGGNMSLLNSNINMKSTPKDNYLKNSRALNPNMPYQSPDIGNMGRLQGNNNGLYSTIQMDRNSPDMLDALKGNPYTHSVVGGL